MLCSSNAPCSSVIFRHLSRQASEAGGLRVIERRSKVQWLPFTERIGELKLWHMHVCTPVSLNPVPGAQMWWRHLVITPQSSTSWNILQMLLNDGFLFMQCVLCQKAQTLFSGECRSDDLELVS